MISAVLVGKQISDPVPILKEISGGVEMNTYPHSPNLV